MAAMAIKEGARLRLRPKVMTVATIVASLLPIMWSTRTGAELEPKTVQALLVDAQEVLLNLGIFGDRFGLKANTVKASGQAFARAALHS